MPTEKITFKKVFYPWQDKKYWLAQAADKYEVTGTLAQKYRGPKTEFHDQDTTTIWYKERV